MFAGRAGLFDNRQEGKRTYGIDAMPQGYRDHSPPPRGLRRLRTDTVGGANPNVAGVFDASGALRPKPRQQGVRYVEKRPVTIAFNETIVTKTRAAAAEETPVAWPSHPKYPPRRRRERRAHRLRAREARRQAARRAGRASGGGRLARESKADAAASVLALPRAPARPDAARDAAQQEWGRVRRISVYQPSLSTPFPA